jgi:aryl-alcohol dehydrogenase-like predicted oxidoreductase
MSAADSIILGTAQFGMPYGVANRTGQLGREQAEATIRIARAGGIRLLDTAVGYGESEALLGTLDLGEIKVMTKLPAVPAGCEDVRGWIRQQVTACLERLHVSRLHGLSLHRPGQLLEEIGPSLYRELRAVQDDGLVEKIGVSIYEPDELGPLLAGRWFDMVQAPFNILDRRLVSSGWAGRLNDMGCEVHARSVFLQGLLASPDAMRLEYFQRWRELLSDWDGWLIEVGLTPLEACLRYALTTPGIDKLVVGVDGPEQLQQVLAAADGLLPVVPGWLSCTDPDLLNPTRWAGM